MDERLLNNIKLYIERQSGGQIKDEKALLKAGKERLRGILLDCKQNCGRDEYQALCREISVFINTDKICERKLYYYCVNFNDPFSSGYNGTGSAADSDNGAVYSKENHRYLDKDETEDLYRFIDAHKKDKTINAVLNQLMYEHNLAPSQVYTNAMLSRQDFSRIINGNKGVSKSKIWSVIIGLHCNLKEADLVLFSAGYARIGNKTDLVMEYFIRQRNYDIMAINDVLYDLNLKLLSVHTEVKNKDSNPETKRSRHAKQD